MFNKILTTSAFVGLTLGSMEVQSSFDPTADGDSKGAQILRRSSYISTDVGSPEAPPPSLSTQLREESPSIPATQPSPDDPFWGNDTQAPSLKDSQTFPDSQPSFDDPFWGSTQTPSLRASQSFSNTQPSLEASQLSNTQRSDSFDPFEASQRD